MPTTEIPAIVAFAARHWGGEGVIVHERAATRSRRDVDGGSYAIPKGWRWDADGFTYLAYMQGGELHWTDGLPWGSFGVVHDEGCRWRVEGYGPDERYAKDHYARNA